MLKHNPLDYSKWQNILSNKSVIWIFFILSTLFTLSIAYRFHAEYETQSNEHFQNSSEQLIHAIEESMADHNAIIQSGVAFYNSSEEVTPSEWENFVNSLHLTQDVLGIVEMKLLHTGTPEASAMLKNPKRAKAMEHARDTGRSTLSTETSFFRNPAVGAAIYIPIYEKNKPHDTRDEKQKAHIGWVYSTLNTNFLFNLILKNSTEHLNFAIYDASAAVLPHQVFSTLSRKHFAPADYHAIMSLPILEQTWRVETFSTRAMLNEIHYDVSLIVGLGGLLLNTLLLVLLLSFSENRKKLEAINTKLSQTHSYLYEAQKLAKLGSWSLNLATNVLEWSDEIFEIFEIDPKIHNPTYEGFLNAVHPDDRDLVNEAYTSSVQQHTTYSYVHRLLMGDGRIKYVHEQGEHFYDANGSPHESRGTVHDITEQHELESALIKKNLELGNASERLSLATQAAGIGIWVWNLKDNSLLWDRQMFKLYDVEDQKMKSLRTYDFWKSHCHHDDLKMMEEAFKNAIDDKVPLDATFRIINVHGEVKHLHATAVVKRGENGTPTHMIGVNRDVTAEKNSQESLTIAKESAERANQVKSDFLANMSHEIRTPLNGVIGLTDLVLQTDLQPSQREYLLKSETAAKALLNLLNNILDYSKIEAHRLTLETTSFDLNEIMENLHAMFSYKAEKKQITLEEHIDDTVPRNLIGDPLRLQQILSNLVVNALKFTDSGFVRISITAKREDEHDRLIFQISDSGIGISPEQQQELFQPFSQVDASFTRKYGGSGLGLMITKELVELMGGNIEVQSTQGIGSTFTFTALFDHTPIFMSESADKTSFKSAVKELPTHKEIHILVVDDNDLNQLVATERLKQMGITSSVANNGLEALEMAKQHHYDAILMDLQMPVMDGLEATKEIRKLPGKEDLPIIALSAAVLKDDLKMAMEAGMNDHIPKPIDKTTLQNVLAKWLND